MKRSLARLLPLAFGAAIIASAHAQSVIWSPTAATGVFENGANWSGGTAPTAGDSLTFSATTQPSIVLSSNASVTGLSFNGTYPAYTFSSSNGSTLSIGAGGINVGNDSYDNIPNSVTFAAGLSLALTDNQYWGTLSSRTLAIYGNISGAYGITKNYDGTLTLGGANTFSGGLTIRVGTLLLSSSSTYSGGSVTSGPVGTGTLTFTTYSPYDPVLGVTETNTTLHNNIAINRQGLTINLDSPKTLTLAGTISGYGQITSGGTGTLALAGANTFSGGVTVAGGTLLLGASSFFDTHYDPRAEGNVTTLIGPVGSGTLIFSGTGNTLGVTGTNTTLHNAINLGEDPVTIATGANSLTLAGAISGYGQISKTGSGTLTLSNSDNFFYGVEVTAGTLALGAADVIPDYALVSVDSGATFDLAGFSETIKALSGSGTVALRAGTLTLYGEGASSFSGVITGTGSLVNSGSGALTLSGFSTFTGGLTMQGSPLTLGTSSSGTVGNITSGPVGTGTLTLSDYASLNVVSGRSLTLHNAISVTSDASVTFNTDTDSLTLLGPISGSGSITKNGSGTLTLGGDSDFTSDFVVAGGTLLLGRSSTGTASNPTSGPVGIGFLRFSGSDNTLGVTGAATILHNQIDLGDDTVTVATGANSLTLAGFISGYTGITKTGSGTLTLSNYNNSFSGGVTVETGTLLLGSSSVATYHGDPFDLDSSPVGLGTLTMEAGTTLAPASGTSLVSLVNPVLLNGSINVGIAGSNNQLRLDAYAGLQSGFRVSSSTEGSVGVNVKGGVLTVATPAPGDDYRSVNTFTVDSGAALVFAFTGSLPSDGVIAAAGSYVGVANGSLPLNSESSDTSVGFLSSANLLIAKLSPADFAGTFGFDSEDTRSPATFTGTLDFSNFSNASFAGLGTLGSAIIGGSATLLAPTSTGRLAFSGLKGGTLEIDAPLLTANHVSSVVIGRNDTTADSGTVILSGSNDYTGGTTLKAGTLTLGGSAALGTGTLNVPNSATSQPTINTIGGNGLVIPNALNVDLTFGTSGVRIGGDFAFTLSGAISGAGIIDKYSVDNLTLSGNNSGFTGAINVLGGTLTLAGTNSGGGSLSTIGVIGSGSAATLTVSVATTMGTLYAYSGTSIVLDNNAALTLNQTADKNIDGVISGSGSLIKGGASSLTLTAANTYTGGTVINAGTLFIGSDSALGYSTGSLAFGGGSLQFNAPVTSARAIALNTGGGTIINVPENPVTLSGIISGPGSLTHQGSGTLTLSSANTYTGGTTVSGFVAFSADNNLGATASGVTLSGGSLVTLAAIPGFTHAITVGNFGGTIDNNGFNSTLSGIISGAGSLSLRGSGTLTLTGANTYSGSILIFDSGTLRAGAANTLSAAGQIFLAGTAILDVPYDQSITGLSSSSTSTSVSIATGKTLTLAGSIGTTFGGAVTGSGTITVTGSGIRTFTGAIANTAALSVASDSSLVISRTSDNLLAAQPGAIANAGTLQYQLITNGYSLSIPTLISGAGDVKFSLARDYTLTNANTYTGATIIDGGANLNIGATSLGAGTVVTLTGAGSQFHVFGDATIRGLSSAPATVGSVQIQGGNTLTLAAPTTGDNFSFASTVNSSGTIIKNGLGTQTFTGAVGSTLIINAGTIGIGDGGTTGSLTGNVTDNANLTFNRADALTYSGVIAGTGTVTNSGTGGTLFLTGANTYSGGTTVSAGLLSIGDGGTTGSVTGNIVNNANLAFNRADAVTFAGIVSGTGSLLKNGAGTLTLSALNTYGGNTTITGGTLALGVANALPATTQLNLTNNAVLNVLYNQTVAGFFGTSSASSALQLANGVTFTVAMPVANNTTTFAGSVTGAGIFAVSGAGGDVVNLTGSVTNTGGTLVGTGATLVIASGGSISGPITTTGTLGFGNPGTQTLSNVISGTGGVSVSAGTTTLSGNNSYSGPTSITGGKLVITGSNTGGGTITVGSGGTFAGTGSTTGPLVLNSGATVSPGASPGTLSVGATTFAGGANFTFEINNTVGTAGSQWDLLSISGALAITANAGNPFTVNITSLDLSNVAASVTGFSSANSYSWLFVSTTTGITGFDATAFQYNTSSFQNSLGAGHFFVSNVGNNLFLNFTPVPEPSTYALLALGLGVIALLARRRK